MVNIVTFGETMVQYNATYVGPYRHDGHHLEYCAGAESNFVVGLGKLGLPNIETSWVSRLGDDEAGDLVLRELSCTTRVYAPKRMGEKTGIFYLNHLDDGRQIRTYHRKSSAATGITFEEVLPHLKSCDLLHVTGITPALSDICRETILETLRYAISVDVPVSFDLNFRSQLWDLCDAKLVFDEMIKLSTFLKLGHDEAEMVWGNGWSATEYARHFQCLNNGVVIVTIGSDGAIAFDGDSVVSQTGYVVDVVDQVGAGDAFIAGFFGSIFRNLQVNQFFDLDPPTRNAVLQDALMTANVCGALTCTQRGDTEAMPSLQEVDSLRIVLGKRTRDQVKRNLVKLGLD